jgi:hypothetical protein
VAKSKRVGIVILLFIILSLCLAVHLGLHLTDGQEKTKQPTTGTPKVTGSTSSWFTKIRSGSNASRCDNLDVAKCDYREVV